jgi:hypothetical protein
VKLARFRKSEVACFLSYVDIDIIQILAILRKSGHIKGRSHKREEG